MADIFFYFVETFLNELADNLIAAPDLLNMSVVLTEFAL